MADISKVQVGETQYDIKDETARGKVAGHVIKNASGTAVTQRDNMQFKTAAVTDENGETVVRNVVQMTRAEYDLITPVEGVIYEITDETVTPSVVETVPIAQGGTGATTAAAARTNLGLGTAATKDSTTSVTDGGTGLPTSGAVYSAIDDVRTDLSDYHVVPSKNLNTGKASITLTKPSARTSNEFPLVNIEAGKKYRIVLDTSAISGYTGSNAVGLRIEGGYVKSEDVYIPVNQGTGQWSYLFTIQASQTTTLAYAHIYAFIPSTEADGATITMSNIMVIAEDETDYTYVPYWVCMRDGMFPRAEQRVLGAKNVLKIDANTQTINGVTFTVNRDSNGNVLNVTANGTATAVTVLVMSTRTYLQDTYTLSGCPVGGNQSTSYALQIRDTNNNTIIYDEGNGGTRALSGGTEYRAVIRIGNGYTANNLVFYPMLRLASDPDDTYVPYAMTNRELTANNINYPVKLTSSNDLNSIKTPGYYYWGDSLPTNLPGTLYYSSMSVQRLWTDGKIIQIIQRNGEIYTRAWTGSAWNGWYKFTGTAV